jgi:hypothetical protein
VSYNLRNPPTVPSPTMEIPRLGLLLPVLWYFVSVARYRAKLISSQDATTRPLFRTLERQAILASPAASPSDSVMEKNRRHVGDV